MKGFQVVVVHRHRNNYAELFEIGPEEIDDLTLNCGTLTSDLARSAIQKEVERRIFSERDWGELDDVDIHLYEGETFVEKKRFGSGQSTKATHVPSATARRVSRCRSLLRLANVVLPPSVREDALDEWMDEIQSAAEEGLPFRRRALSIFCRSLPVLALRARLPVRARRGEG